jgi:hypothetical protein
MFENHLTIRAAGTDHAIALRYLAEIDTSPWPPSASATAESWPTPRPTLAAAELLRLRRRQLTEPARRPRRPVPALIRRVAAALR